MLANPVDPGVRSESSFDLRDNQHSLGVSSPLSKSKLAGHVFRRQSEALSVRLRQEATFYDHGMLAGKEIASVKSFSNLYRDRDALSARRRKTSIRHPLAGRCPRLLVMTPALHAIPKKSVTKTGIA